MFIRILFQKNHIEGVLDSEGLALAFFNKANVYSKTFNVVSTRREFDGVLDRFIAIVDIEDNYYRYIRGLDDETVQNLFINDDSSRKQLYLAIRSMDESNVTIGFTE